MHNQETFLAKCFQHYKKKTAVELEVLKGRPVCDGNDDQLSGGTKC